MHLDLRGPAGLAAYKLLTNIVVPRPIAWITSRDLQGGLNLAPFSFFNLMGSDPPLIVVGIGNESPGRPKHTARNIEATGEFVVNMVTEELVQAMNLTAADFPEGENELSAARLLEAPSRIVGVPRVAEAKAALECRLHHIDRVGQNNLIVAEVVGLYTAEGLVDERFRMHGFHPVGRMGSPSWYARTRDLFEVPRVTYDQVRKAETDA